MKIKLEYAKKLGLIGAFVWEASGEDKNLKDLTNLIVSELKN